MTNISSAALNNRTYTMRRNRNSVKVAAMAGFGPIANILILGFILAGLGLIYLTQVTKTNSYGYQINELKSQRESLQAANQQLEVDIAKAQSLNVIKDSSVTAALVDEPVSTTFLEN